jgi:hypothetical protein
VNLPKVHLATLVVAIIIGLLMIAIYHRVFNK